MKCFTKFVLTLAALALLANAAQRFDYLVRADFFAGMAGDQAAMDRAMQLCEDTLAKDPKHAEALVWHGSGMLFLSGQSFRKGDTAQGGRLWAGGMKQMADAVQLAPANPAVLIPRGATLLTAAAQLPNPEKSRELTQTGVEDYENVYEIQKPYFDKLPGHSRGELLFGLAAGYDRLGNTGSARQTFETLAAIGPASGHEDEAKQWLATGTYTRKQVQCTGCHAGK